MCLSKRIVLFSSYTTQLALGGNNIISLMILEMLLFELLIPLLAEFR